MATAFETLDVNGTYTVFEGLCVRFPDDLLDNLRRVAVQFHLGGSFEVRKRELHYTHVPGEWLLACVGQLCRALFACGVPKQVVQFEDRDGRAYQWSPRSVAVPVPRIDVPIRRHPQRWREQYD